MEVSELLRRGNFNRSSIYLQNKQQSYHSLDQVYRVSNGNFHNSQSPAKSQLQTKATINNTNISNPSNSSQIGKDLSTPQNRKLKDKNKIRSLMNLSMQSEDKNEQIFQEVKNSRKLNKQQQSLSALQQILKNDLQLQQEGKQNENCNNIIQNRLNSPFKKENSSQFQTEDEEQHEGQTPTKKQRRRKADNKNSEKEKIRDIIVKQIANKNNDDSLFKKMLNGKSIHNLTNIGSFNKKSTKDTFSSTTLNEISKFDVYNQSLPKTTKQNLFNEAHKNIDHLFKDHISNISQSSTPIKDNYKNRDSGFSQLTNSQLSSKQELNPILEIEKQSEVKRNYRNYKSQEKIDLDFSPKKKGNQNINLLSFLIRGQSGNEIKTSEINKDITKNINKNEYSSKDRYENKQNHHENKNRIINRNYSQDNMMRKTIHENFTDDEQRQKQQFLSSTSISFQKKQNNTSQEMKEGNQRNQIMNGQQNKNISSITGIVKIKKRISIANQKIKDQIIQQNNHDESYHIDSNLESIQNNAIKDDFFLHKKIVEDLKKDEGYDIHDIYGIFNDKVKQIQLQVSEQLKYYQLAQTVVEQVEKEKNQSRVIDSVENTIHSIFVALDYLDKIPSNLNERQVVDNILAQQAVTLMKSTQTNLVLQIETIMIYAKYCKAISNFGKALRLYKQCKNMSISPLMQKYRMKSYKNIGQCFQNLKLYNKSLLYIGKYLECAWHLNDTEAELKAYDLLGVTHYLIGDLENARFYHDKMSQCDNEQVGSQVRQLYHKKMIEKLKKLNTEDYKQKMAGSYKNFYAKINNKDYEEDYECSSSEDEFNISIPKSSSQQKNQEYEDYLNSLSPSVRKKEENDKKRFIAIYNAEDRLAQKQIIEKANTNIRMLGYKRNAQSMPATYKFPSAQSFKPINSTQKTPFRINQFSNNRNIDNYKECDQRMQKNQNYDFFKLIEDNNDKKLKNKIVYILSKFQNNLIFALSKIHYMRERDKYAQYQRRYAFSGIADFNKPNNLILMNINISEEKAIQLMEEKKKFQEFEDKSKPNSNKSKYSFITRFQMHPEVEALLKV